MDDSEEQLWPSAGYYQQIQQLQGAVGQTIYLAEVRDTAINAGVKFSDEALILLAVIDYPQPDPYRQLCPHMLILDDGRGVNLGRVARVSINQAFGPAEDDVLFQNTEFMDKLVFAPRTLSHASISETSKGILCQMFGDQPGKLLETTKKGRLADGQLDQENIKIK